METSQHLEEAQLLKSNREAVVELLNTLGFAGINESTPLSEIAECMKWAGGLRDIRLATMNKTTGEYAAYTEEEWNNMSASSNAAVVKLGLHVRVEGIEFLLSKEYALSSNGATTMPWSTSQIDVSGLTNYGAGSWGYHLSFDSEGNTNKILAYGASHGLSFEAAEQARAYKASTFADGGFDDPTTWSLPAIGMVLLLYRYRKELNEALTVFFGSGSVITTDYIWSSDEFSSSGALRVYMYYGVVHTSTKTIPYGVRPVAPVPVASSAMQTP